MLDELRELYQEVILDHGRNPRNCRCPAEANRHAHGHNPLCGDTVTVHLKLNGTGAIEDVAFEGKGCAISIASASLMTEILKGKTRDQAVALFRSFQDMCTKEAPEGAGESATAAVDEDDLDRLQVLSGVREFPMRVKCATLAWHTFNAALVGEQEVTTE